VGVYGCAAGDEQRPVHRCRPGARRLCLVALQLRCLRPRPHERDGSLGVIDALAGHRDEV
jgi:hypothetical protein